MTIAMSNFLSTLFLLIVSFFRSFYFLLRLISPYYNLITRRNGFHVKHNLARTLRFLSISSYSSNSATFSIYFPLKCASGLTACVFSPHATPTVVDSRLTLWGALKTKANVVLAVPLFLEEWTKEGDEVVNALKTFDKVVC